MAGVGGNAGGTPVPNPRRVSPEVPLGPQDYEINPGGAFSSEATKRQQEGGKGQQGPPGGGHRGMRGAHQGLCEDRATIPEAAPCQASPHWRWPSPRRMRRPPSCSCCPEGRSQLILKKGGGSNDGLGEGGPPPRPVPQVTVQEGLVPVEVTCPAMLTTRGVGLTNLK